jgi:regulatory protein
MRPAKRVSEAYLRRVAAWYLERYEASSGRLQRVLRVRVQRSATAHGTDPADAQPWIEAILADFAAMGAVDDARFAEGVLRRLAARGVARSRWRAELGQRGVPAATAARAIAQLQAEEAEEAEGGVDPARVAAARHARRRGFGPWARHAVDDVARRKQAMGLMRAGHAPDVVRAVLDPRNVDAARAWADGLLEDDACPG